MMEVKENWFGWIPTNRGKIKFNFIELPKELKSKNVRSSYKEDRIFYENIDVSYLSDSYTIKSYSKFVRREHSAIANITFEYKPPNIEGSIEIIYKDFCSISSKFVCESNGIVEFKNILCDTDAIKNVVHEIKSLLYVLVKTIIHGDSHHHQKIDVALPIIADTFDPSKISSSLVDYLKLVERNIKNTKDCESFLRNENSVYEVDGYLAYFKSFTLLFEDNAVKKDFEHAQCVIESLKCTVAKRKNKADFESSLRMAFITFLGLFISINILINGFWPVGYNRISGYLENQDRFIYFFGSLVFILCMYINYINCKMRAYTYSHYYNFFELSKFIKNADFFDLNWKGKVLRLSSILFSSICILIWYYS